MIRIKIKMMIGVCSFEEIAVKPSDAGLRLEIEEAVENLKKDFTSKEISSDPVIGMTRKLFRSLGIDPTRYRPSSEALLRRIISGKGFPFINSAVDVNNLGSILFKLPMGIYDRSSIKGEITIDLGKEKEYYKTLSGAILDAKGKPIARDLEGIFGGPISDSDRTKVVPETSKALLIVYAPMDVEKQHLQQTLEFMRDRFLRYNGGSIKELTIYGDL
jgi:DNA/RNA-binding domain of Phe-tRNA-synthetase-like protein